MRSLVSKNSHRRTRRNQIILGLLLVFIMFSSTIAYAFQTVLFSGNPQEEVTESVEYNGYNFNEQNGFWFLDSEKGNFVFRYNPHEVPVYPLTKKLVDFEDENLVVSSSVTGAETELRINLAPFVEGILTSNEINCNQNTIVLLEKEQENIYEQENCIFIEGPTEQLIRLTDSFLFEILDIT